MMMMMMRVMRVGHESKQRQNDTNKKGEDQFVPATSFSALPPRPFHRAKVTSITPPFSPSIPPALPLNYSFLHLLSALLLTSAFTLHVGNGLHYFKAPILQQRVEALVQSEQQKHLLAMEYAQILQKARCGPCRN